MRREVEQDLIDICLELKDIGFKCDITRVGHGKVEIYKDERFKYDLISGVVERITEFMEYNKYKVTVKRVFPEKSFFNRIFGQKEINYVEIKFLNVEIDKFFNEFLKK